MGNRTLTRLLAQLACQLEPAFATEVDVDQRDVWPQLGDLPLRIGRGPGSPDHIETLFGEQTAHFLSEARVVVDDQATQTHKACTIARTGRAAPLVLAPKNELQGSLPPASVKTTVGGWPQPQLGAGRADKESLPGDAAPALNTGPQTMELRHLRYFVAVADELHFRRAAERLHVAQPAVSEQVRKLENELGVRLFERTHRNVALTDAGAAMLPEAHRVLRQAEAARLAARSASDRPGRVLRIGYVPTALLASVPRTLRRLVANTPNLKTTMEPGPGLELSDAVRAGELDVAVVSLPVPTAGLRVTPLGEQRAVAVFPTGHEHAVKPHVGLEQIAPERIVVLPRDADRPFYDAVLATCCAAGISPTLIETPDGQVDRVLLAVASGAGMALLPECVAERYADAGVRFVALNGESPVLTTAIVSPRHTEHLPTLAFLRAASRTLEQRPPIASERSVLAA